MAETVELATTTEVTVQNTILDIFTYYDSSFAEFLQFFIIEILGMVGTVNFAEGELGYSIQGLPNFSANVNDHGELIVNDLDTDPYFVDDLGYLIKGDVLPAPIALDASNVLTTSFTANWRGVVGAAKYYLDVSTDPQFDTYVTGYQNKDMGTALTENVTGLSAGTTYYYRVRAVDDVQTSLDSNIISVATVSGLGYGALYNYYVASRTEKLLISNTHSSQYLTHSWPVGVTVYLQAQSFVLSNTKTITSIILPAFAKIGSPNFNIRVSLYNSSGDIPTTKIADSTNVISATNSVLSDNVFIFNNISLIAGSYNFAITYEDIVTHTSSDCLKIWWDVNNPYSEGMSSANDGGGWSPLSGFDICSTIIFAEGSLAPLGSHIPTKDEFDALVTYLGGDTVAGGHLKEIGLVHWNDPNEGADNSSGFTMFGSGYRSDSDGSFGGINIEAAIWSLTPYDISTSYFLDLTNHYEGADVGTNSNIAGFSVRCLLDDPSGWHEGDMVTDYDGNSYATVKIGAQVWMAANLIVTHYNDGTLIPIITDNTAWAALTTDAMCYYDNDISNS